MWLTLQTGLQHMHGTEAAMAEITIDDIERSERVRAVTDNFFFWQGLRFVALGPLLILASLSDTLGMHKKVGDVVLIACMIAAIFASTAIGKRYRRDFGHVRPIPGAHVLRSQLKWLVVYPLMFGALAVDLLRPMPILVSGPVWAIGILLYRASTGGGRSHYVALAGCIAALGLTPLIASVTGREMVSLMFLVLGAGFTACAWLDDREMRSILRGA
jgi:hypothetical protein